MMRHLRLLARDHRGAAVIELALLAPILALLTIGTVDLSNAFGRKLALEQAAQRAMEKVMNTTGVDTVEGTIKQEAVAQASSGTDTITEDQVTVTFRLECNTVVQADPNGDCAPGETTSRYILVKVEDTYAPFFAFRFAGIDADGTYHVSAQAGVRVK